MENTCDITLDPMLTMQTIEPLYEACKQALASGAGNVTIHAGQVERLGTPALQLLLSLKMSLIKRERCMEIKDPSPAFVATVQCVGLTPFLSAGE